MTYPPTIKENNGAMDVNVKQDNTDDDDTKNDIIDPLLVVPESEGVPVVVAEKDMDDSSLVVDAHATYGHIKKRNSSSCFCGRRCLWITMLCLFVMFGLLVLLGSSGRLHCQGDNSCTSSSGRDSVGLFSCNGDRSCQGNVGKIAMFACNGDDSCNANHGQIERFSCNGDKVCRTNTANIGKASCNGDDACDNNAGTIERAACNGDGACHNNHRRIPRGTCNGDNACPGGD